MDCHAIHFFQVGQHILSHHHLNLSLGTGHGYSPLGHVVENTLFDEKQKFIIPVLGGSVWLEAQKASCAWIVEDYDEKKGKITATLLLENITLIMSFHSEYTIIFL